MSDDAAEEVAAWLGGRAERTLVTACAWVFLIGDAAFKAKRPVAYGYLDYSTPELRRWAVERELAFNRASAPDIYRAVRRVTRAAGGGLEFDGEGALVDHVLEMRRFDPDAVLSAQPDALDGELAEALGRTIARIHHAAERRDAGGAASLAYVAASNAKLLEELSPRLGREKSRALEARTGTELSRLAPLLDARARAGFLRRCHGDLHLGNILLEAGRPVLFDCIEFSDALSDIDVLYDLAFLLMDLDFRSRREAAVRVLSAYLDEAARVEGEDFRDGLAALPAMMSLRAGVRAHVSAHAGDDAAAKAYLEAALRLLSPAPPRMVAVGGFSGSGKSGLARRIAPELEPAPGAVILRTDEIRKRLAGAAPTERLGARAYGAEMDERVHAALCEEARALLAAGRSVVADATFMDPKRRRQIEAIAQRAGVHFEGVWLEAPPQALAARVAGRRGDASDATPEVLRAQLAQGSGPADWRRLDASGPPEATAAAWRARVA